MSAVDSGDGNLWVCGYCLWVVKDGDEWEQCPECSRVVHAECWHEHGGCVTLGCHRHPSGFGADAIAIDGTA